MTIFKPSLTLLTTAVLLTMVGCGDNNLSTPDDATRVGLSPEQSAALEAGVIPDEFTEEGNAGNQLAIATVGPASGSQVSGFVSFARIDGEDGVRIVARITGLPDGEHGIHIHENGDCSAPDASSAGSHFDPHNAPHAGPDSDSRHAGDLGNIVARNQEGTLDISDAQMLDFNTTNSVVGKAVVVHMSRDDLMTQPSGNSGDPVACGVIELQDQNAYVRL